GLVLGGSPAGAPVGARQGNVRRRDGCRHGVELLAQRLDFGRQLALEERTDKDAVVAAALSVRPALRPAASPSLSSHPLPPLSSRFAGRDAAIRVATTAGGYN